MLNELDKPLSASMIIGFVIASGLIVGIIALVAWPRQQREFPPREIAPNAYQTVKANIRHGECLTCHGVK